MGGGESLGIGLNHLELFSYVGGFSPGIRTADFEKSYGQFMANPKMANERLKLLWIGCGSDDSLFPASEALAKMLDEKGIKHVFHSSSGAHTWTNWRRYLDEFAPLLF
jgi:enterochelin esterase family protein